MLTFIELLIGVVVIVGVARYIIKGYSATGVICRWPVIADYQCHYGAQSVTVQPGFNRLQRHGYR